MKSARHLFIVFLTAVAATSSLSASAQNCNSHITSNSPTSRFHDNRDGSVTDKHTGLQWARCSLGQTWKESSCRGEARALPFAIAALLAEEDWRLPSIQELSSLLELRCYQPAINTEIFPATDSGAYWTNTRFASHDGRYWQVHFLHGEAVPEKADSSALVRWVRKH